MISKSKFTLRVKRIEVLFTPLFIVILPALYIAGYLSEYLIMLAAISLHEAGHIAASLLLGVCIRKIWVLPFGILARIDMRSGLSFMVQCCIYAAGPAANLLLAAVAAILGMGFVAEANLCLGVFNLLAVLPLDGGNILKVLLQKKLGIYTTVRVMCITGGVVAALVMLAGMVQFIGTWNNPSLLIIGGVIMYSLKKESGEAAMMNIKGLIYKKERFLKKGIYPIRDIAALGNVSLGQLFKSLDHDCYHIVHVLDREMNILFTITEERILEALMSNGPEMIIGDVDKYVAKHDEIS